jgi:phosphate transport system substrate-binding protein
VRIIQLDSSPGFAPKTLALNGSDQIAQYVAGGTGKWSIAYDEFGYAKTYGAPAAWVQNASGAFVQPYAENISAALKSALLRPDLSQELSGVYASGDPLAYPISAYSYVVTQCAGGDRATCKGAYINSGITETMARWLRYIACDGQVNMARIGYSPLPPNLSQEIANSITRMQGSGSPEQLSAGNCANPTFSGSLGAGSSSPGDPLANVASLSGDGGQAAAASNGDTAAAAAASTGPAAASAGAGKSGSAIKSAGGGSTDYRDARPVAYTRPGLPGTTSTLLLVFLAVVAIPPLIAGFMRRRKAREPPAAS